MSGGGSLAGFTKNVHMEKSEIVRPGSNGSQSVRIGRKPYSEFLLMVI